MAGDGNFKWWWQTGTDDCPETYNGPCDTRDEAIAEARANDGRMYGFVILEADRAVPSCKIFDAGRVLEDYGERNEECWGEDGPDVECTAEQEIDLEIMLAATLTCWFEKHGISRNGFCFDTQRNQETFQPVEQEATV